MMNKAQYWALLAATALFMGLSWIWLDKKRPSTAEQAPPMAAATASPDALLEKAKKALTEELQAATLSQLETNLKSAQTNARKSSGLEKDFGILVRLKSIAYCRRIRQNKSQDWKMLIHHQVSSRRNVFYGFGQFNRPGCTELLCPTCSVSLWKVCIFGASNRRTPR